MEFQLSEVTELCRKVHSKEAARDAGNLATSHMHFTLVTDCAQVADMEMQLSEVTEMRRKVHSAEAARDAARDESSKATSMLHNLEARLGEVCGLRTHSLPVHAYTSCETLGALCGIWPVLLCS